MTPLEIIALVFTILGIIKIGVTIINPQLRLKFAKKVFKHQAPTMIFGILLALVIAYYVFQELNIIQVMSVFALFSALLIIHITPFAQEFTKAIEPWFQDGKILRKAWFGILLWLILFVWTIIHLAQ